MRKVYYKLMYVLMLNLSRWRWSLVYHHLAIVYNLNEIKFFQGKAIKVYGNGRLTVGKRSYIGNYSTIQICDDRKVQIGNDVSISHNVRIYTSNRSARDFIKGTDGYVSGDVSIGNRCWIGANVMVLEGSVIHDNVVIGANSVVKGVLESNSVYAGSPLKKIRSLE